MATFALIAAPLLLMYVGGVLADLPLGRETGRFAGAVVGAALLAACLAATAALVAALTIRRGLAVTAVIVLLLVSYTVVSTIQGISSDTGHETVGEVAGMFSPYTLVNGVQVFLFDSPERHPDPTDRHRDGAALPRRHRGHRPRRGRRDAAPLPEGERMTSTPRNHSLRSRFRRDPA